MVPKFANPHSLSQDVERTTRSDVARRTGSTSIVHDENTHVLQRDLDSLLRDSWGNALAATSPVSNAKNLGNTCTESGLVAFRLLSTMKRPQHISLDPKPPPPPVSREPDCEDDEIQAETRRTRSLAVAVEFESLVGVAFQDADAMDRHHGRVMDVSLTRSPPKVDTVGARVLTNMPFTGPLPRLLVMEEARPRKSVRRRDPPASESFAPSPHEPRPSYTFLPVTSVPSQSYKKRRKPVRERPPPAYWRPSPDLRGKCMGYALGYPSSWASEQPYVRDTMKKGALACHAVHHNA